MRYMLLICADEKAEAQMPKAEVDTIVQGHMRFAEELRAAGKMVVGERLRPENHANRVRLKAGQRQVMDGPFAETKEALAGFYLMPLVRDEPQRVVVPGNPDFQRPPFPLEPIEREADYLCHPVGKPGFPRSTLVRIVTIGEARA